MKGEKVRGEISDKIYVKFKPKEMIFVLEIMHSISVWKVVD